MNLLTATDLTLLRAAVDSVLTEAATVERAARAEDAYGGWSETWTTIETTVCRIVARPGRQGQVAGVEAATFPYQVLLPNATAALPGDRVTTLGRTFRVTGVATPRSQDVLTDATAVEVR